MNRYRDWLEQAQRDLGRARIDLEHAYWEWACFTSQQAAEKAVKAVLLYHGFDAWGHAITPMLRKLAELTNVPEERVRDGQLLDAHYIPTRDPNGFPEGKPADYFNEEKGRAAVDAAHAILRFCEDHLSGQDGPAAPS